MSLTANSKPIDLTEKHRRWDNKDNFIGFKGPLRFSTPFSIDEFVYYEIASYRISIRLGIVVNFRHHR